jgi:predicted membrane channel-forming protein YqfA (hemolysin III family)
MPVPEASPGTHNSDAELRPDEQVPDDPAAYRMPLVIGVTGHRDLIAEDTDTLQKSVLKVFDDLKKAYPDTPFVVLTPLAEGADRLVANVALGCGAEIVVPLPMSEQLYETDFRDANAPAGAPSASQQEFQRLLKKSKARWEMPLVPGSTPERVARNEGGARDLQYLLVGLHVARHCQILIALWDGRTPGSTGGTWQIVDYKLTGQLPNLSPAQLEAFEKLESPFGYRQTILEAPETGPVYHIRTRRKKTSPPDTPLDPTPTYTRLAPGKGRTPERPTGETPPKPLGELRRPPKQRWQMPFWRFFWGVVTAADAVVTAGSRVVAFFRPRRPPATLEDAYFEGQARIFENIDTFNHHVRKLLTNGEWREKRSSLLPAPATQALAGTLRRSEFGSIERLASAYAVADSLAIHFQTRTQKTLKLLVFLVLGAVVLFGVYAHLGGEEWQLWCLAAYILVLAVADFFYLCAKREDQQNKHQDYRTVAEGLRVQFYWRLAGMSESAADYYLSKQRSELDWIRHAVQAWGVLTPPLSRPQFEPVIRYWIKYVEAGEKGATYHGQASYYGRTAGPRDLNYSILYRELGSGFLVASLGLAAAATAIGTNWPFYRYFIEPPPLATAFYLTLPVALIIGLCHLGLKLRELTKELRHDQEEFTLHLRYGIAGLLFAGLILIVLLGVRDLLLLISGIHLPEPPGAEQPWKTQIQDWLIVGMATFALIAALLHTFRERRGFAEQHKQYQRMAAVFERANARLLELLRAGEQRRAQLVLSELGREALAEHGDWLLLHRERPMELPKVEL